MRREIFWRSGRGGGRCPDGRSNGNDVAVAHWAACRPSEPVVAHNLQRNGHMAMVVAFVAVIIRDYNGFRDKKLQNTPDYLITDSDNANFVYKGFYHLVGNAICERVHVVSNKHV